MFDCALVAVRRKDPWNPIASGALTGGCCNSGTGCRPRRGQRRLAGLLALIEGVSIALTRLTAPPPPMPEEMMAMEGGAPMGGVNGAPGVEVGNNPPTRRKRGGGFGITFSVVVETRRRTTGRRRCQSSRRSWSDDIKEAVYALSSSHILVLRAKRIETIIILYIIIFTRKSRERQIFVDIVFMYRG